jgi:hypothetical protein
MLKADALTWSIGAVLAAGAMAAGPATLRVGVTPPFVALFTLAPAVHTHAAPEGDEAPEPVTPPADGIAIPPTDLRELVHAYQAVQDPEPLADPSRPFCRRAQVPQRRATSPRSITLLVLRGVGSQALAGPTPEMPNLARIAAEQASFDNVIAGADDPTQGLVQILAGVAPFTPTRFHELGLAPRVPSLPRTMRALGLASYFVSSVDLSAGRERTLLANLGFDDVDEPSFDEEAAAMRELGNDDATLEALRARLDSTRGRPRLVVATLGSAFQTLPAQAAPAQAEPADGGVPDAGIIAANPTAVLTSLDAKLGQFITAWTATEGARGGVLAIVGDSVLVRRTASGEVVGLSDTKFHVPLVLVNLRPPERTLARERKHALGGLLDVAQTLLGLEGQGPVGCFQGRDLLAADDPVPGGRRLAAFAGPDQQYGYVFDGRFRWQIDRTDMQGAFGVFDLQTDAALAHDLYDATDVAVGSTRDYLLSVVGIGRYLASNDRYVLGDAQVTVTPLPAVEAPTRIGAATGNDRAALLASFGPMRASSIDHYLVPVTIDRDLEPRVAGVALGEILPQLVRAAAGGTLVLDIALPDIASPWRSVDAARRVALALRGRGAASGVAPLLFPRDPIMAMSFAARTTYPVYVRVPGQSADFVDFARQFGARGIVFEANESRVAPIERAHLEGLRVVVAGVSADAAYPGPNRPDFVVLESPAAPTP